MQTVGIVCNKNKERAQGLLKEVSGYLQERKIKVYDNLTNSLTDIISKVEMIVALGGDGTILNIANTLKGKDIPVLGVNCGKLGFITDVRQEEVYEQLDQILKENFKKEVRFMLDVKVTCKDEPAKQYSFSALNDVVIHREGVSRYLNISLRVNGDDIYSVGGDGIIVSTPTGSTAYNLSAGGPIVHSTAENIIITPICHHSLIQKSIVLSKNDHVVLDIYCKKENERAHMIIDGQKSMEVREGDMVEVAASSFRFTMIRNSKRNYFQVIKQKFGWQT
ncbi:MAG: NAD(+)/NADH kinase [Candidatus Omnitrophica bacterium]|nr:NAD(+)/NADH kinase [Candidatus Omnitrophota bacterium]